MLNTAVKAARRAGAIILRSFEKHDSLKIDVKGKNDFVSEVDRQAEATIIDMLRKAYPNHAILAEESGIQNGQQDEYQWIIDPLDGTTNFLHGNPQFSVSIGLMHKGILQQAVVYDPLRNELYTASRGEGTLLNDRRVRVSTLAGLEGALIGTGFPYTNHEHIDSYLDSFKAILYQTAGIRRPGSAALDLAYVACGRLDGFWEIGLKPWDIAAGALLILEAGGFVSDFGGGEQYFGTGNIVAGTPRVHKAMLETIQPHLSEALKK